ncbi:MAG TPA: hypothetical protein VN493_28460 [Thermoanaerobaculia bacterium]|nr:hypothetical protein [Thermoanaerobaculia bacterium]
MLSSFGWTLQLLALALVGGGFLIGLFHNQIRAELAVCAVGGVLFLLGRWLQSREGR